MEPTTLGPTNRNARVAHIRKFVCVPPPRGHTLRLVTCEDPATVLGEWLREGCEDNGSTPEDVDQRLREHADTIQAEVVANLVWQTETGLVVVTKRLKCKADIDPAGMDPAQAAQAEALGIVGTKEGWFIQAQRHQEAMMRSYFSAHQTQIGQGNALISILGGMLNEAQMNAHRAHLELDKLRAQQRLELDKMYEQLRESEPDNSNADDPEGGARADLLRQLGGALTQALPFVIAQVAKQISAGVVAAPDAPPAPPKAASGE